MKKTILAVAIGALTLTSCHTVKQTVSTMDVDAGVSGRSAADLIVDDMPISFTMTPSKSVRRGGTDNVINTAYAEALKANGNGEVLVHPNYKITKRRGLFGSKITSVTVTGHVGKYRNFHVVK